jgi:aspartyl-tRNA(Asn)/glutamyl-tRNA(Gln) amidotransferase subunit A
MPGRAGIESWTSLDASARRRAAQAAAVRAEALNPHLDAFVSLTAGPTVAQTGLLAGMPYAAKDLFATAGRHPTCGLERGIDLGIMDDAEVLQRLDRAGAVRIGFATMTALAYEPSGHNIHQPPARNPWNADFIPGGSSSGSAVAVASGMAAVALGTDTGGSVRIPAQACGVTAWKPTAGVVSACGAMALAPTLDTIGLLARFAADIAAAAPILADGLPAPPPVIRAMIAADVLHEADAEVRRACEDGIAAIEAAGVTLGHVVSLPAIKAADAHALVVMQAEAARVHRARIDDPAVEPVLRKRLAKGLTIDDTALAASIAARAVLAAQFLDQIFAGTDALILPVIPVRTPPCSACDPASPSFDARLLYRLSEWTRFVNMLGFPAVALPVGFDSRGLPVAIQIVGRPHADLALIALAQAVQKRTDWSGRVPAGLASH